MFTEAYFPIIRDISVLMKSTEYQPDDLIEFSIAPELLVQNIKQLGNRPESLTSKFHQELAESLVPQLMQLTQDPKSAESAGYVLGEFQTLQNSALEWVNGEVESGRTKLKQ